MAATDSGASRALEDAGASTADEAAPRAPDAGRARDRLVVAGALLVGTLLLYFQVRHHAFVFLDDGQYVAENPRVRTGLSWANVQWAFTTLYFKNWHPLTWLSHMLDVSLFGLDPGAHHLVNAVLHAANGAVLFLVLHRMTGALWRSAIVAALFAVHPLHVESVAWVAERKDVLSTLFGLLALGAYWRHAQRPGAGRYALVVLCFALSLLAKPMWVTLPFLLLLLDAWPLGRFAGSRGPGPAPTASVPAPRLLLEKVPLLALSGASSVVTLAAQSIVRVDEVGFGARLANAVVSYARYVWMTVWPADLAALYPYRSPLPAWEVAAAALLVGGVTAIVLRQARHLPWAAVGWLWFLGTLVPVIGLVQVGSQSMADRYAYLPSVGLFVVAVWGAHHLAAGRGRLLGAFAAAVLLVLSLLTWRQAARWKDHETLFRHTVLVTQENPVARGILAMGLRRMGKLEEALEHASLATRLDPDDARHWSELARVARDLKRPQESYDAARRAVALEPDHGLPWTVLGQAAGDAGLADEAEAALRRAAALLPDEPQPWNELGIALARNGRTVEALDAYRRALTLDPGSAPTWSNLAILQQRLGRAGEAGEAFAAAARADPANPTIWRNLGVFHAMTGRPSDAAAAFQEALRLKPRDPELLVRLGLAQLALGARADALATAARLDGIAPELATELRTRAGAAP
jgi:Flp pilus assembly protein TadD